MLHERLQFCRLCFAKINSISSYPSYTMWLPVSKLNLIYLKSNPVELIHVVFNMIDSSWSQQIMSCPILNLKIRQDWDWGFIGTKSLSAVVATVGCIGSWPQAWQPAVHNSEITHTLSRLVCVTTYLSRLQKCFHTGLCLCNKCVLGAISQRSSVWRYPKC